mmetsp:Transcript_12386/g.30030  ORF Transcript_12386/g.30030 Transcript_12386/m.30030 type:complete len:212 (-) Transcript_12386:6383-7018(-)
MQEFRLLWGRLLEESFGGCGPEGPVGAIQSGHGLPQPINVRRDRKRVLLFRQEGFPLLGPQDCHVRVFRWPQNRFCDGFLQELHSFLRRQVVRAAHVVVCGLPFPSPNRLFGLRSSLQVVRSELLIRIVPRELPHVREGPSEGLFALRWKPLTALAIEPLEIPFVRGLGQPLGEGHLGWLDLLLLLAAAKHAPSPRRLHRCRCCCHPHSII